MSEFFQEVKGATVLTRKSGVFKEAKIYASKENQSLFLQVGGSFVRMIAHGETSVNRLMWDKISGVAYLERHGIVYLAQDMKVAA